MAEKVGPWHFESRGLPIGVALNNAKAGETVTVLLCGRSPFMSASGPSVRMEAARPVAQLGFVCVTSRRRFWRWFGRE